MYIYQFCLSFQWTANLNTVFLKQDIFYKNINYSEYENNTNMKDYLQFTSTLFSLFYKVSDLTNYDASHYFKNRIPFCGLYLEYP